MQISKKFINVYSSKTIPLPINRYVVVNFFYNSILIWSLKAVPGNAPRSSDKNITSTLFLYV